MEQEHVYGCGVLNPQGSELEVCGVHHVLGRSGFAGELLVLGSGSTAVTKAGLPLLC